MAGMGAVGNARIVAGGFRGWNQSLVSFLGDKNITKPWNQIEITLASSIHIYIYIHTTSIIPYILLYYILYCIIIYIVHLQLVSGFKCSLFR